MLARIERISDMAVFRDFRWNALEDFGTHNLIFGANGSGKSTISNALRSFGGTPLEPGKLRLAFADGTKLELSSAGQSPYPFSVFNAKFVTENLLYQQGATAQTLYYIGAESAEARKELDIAEEKLALLRTEATKKSSEATAARGKLDSFGTDTARLIRTTLIALGDTRYTKYQRPQYFRAVKASSKNDSEETKRLAAMERESLAARAKAPTMSVQPKVINLFSNVSQLATGTEAALKLKLDLRGVLDVLENPEKAQWLQQGAALHSNTNYTECLFCGRQDFPSPRRDLLERAFSDAYVEFQESMNGQIEALSKHAEQCRDLSVPDKDLVYEDLRVAYQTSVDSLATCVGALESWLSSAQKMLVRHLQDPSGNPGTLPAVPSNGARETSELNVVIATHNERCENIQENRNAAGKALEDSMVAESLFEHSRLMLSVAKADADVGRPVEKLEHAETEVQERRGRLRDSIGAARGLETDIHHYLGHNELQIRVNRDESAFVITRGGRPAEGLSEGEQTAIALLYFLRSLDHDDGARRQDRIVVLDDPVSSLDGNSLLAASEYIRERTRDVKQLFVFTHNDQFFLDVLRWMKAEDGKRGTVAQAYMLNVNHISEGRSSKIVALDPMIEEYRSMYLFGFAEMYRYRLSLDGEAIGDIYRLPNLARRFLEQYCLHRFPSIRSGLGVAKEQFAGEGLEDVATNRLVSLLNVESHGMEERTPGLGLARFQELRNVVGDVLRLVELSDERHYKALEEIVVKSSPVLRRQQQPVRRDGQ